MASLPFGVSGVVPWLRYGALRYTEFVIAAGKNSWPVCTARPGYQPG
ncbi:MAG: hypothetical protein ACXVRJ_05965 [Gaiellaceae bacterium]